MKQYFYDLSFIKLKKLTIVNLNMNMYSLPQEIEVWYVIPAIRRELSRLLTQIHGLSYERSGNILGISKAAISQYNKSKRASKITLHSKVISEVEKSAKRLSLGKSEANKEIIRVLKYMRENKLPFKVCDDEMNCDEAIITYEKYWE